MKSNMESNYNHVIIVALKHVSILYAAEVNRRAHALTSCEPTITPELDKELIAILREQLLVCKGKNTLRGAFPLFVDEIEWLFELSPRDTMGACWCVACREDIGQALPEADIATAMVQLGPGRSTPPKVYWSLLGEAWRGKLDKGA